MTTTASPAYYQTQSEKLWEQALEEVGSNTKERKEQFADLWRQVDIIAAAAPKFYEPPTLKYERLRKSCEETGKQHQTELGSQQKQQLPDPQQPGPWDPNTPSQTSE